MHGIMTSIHAAGAHDDLIGNSLAGGMTSSGILSSPVTPDIAVCGLGGVPPKLPPLDHGSQSLTSCLLTSCLLTSCLRMTAD